MDRTSRVLRAGLMLAALLALAGCAGYPGGTYPSSGYPGGYPDSSYPGGYPDNGYPDNGYPGGGYGNQLTGTVQNLDLNYGRLLLAADGSGYGGSQVEVFVDNGTRLYYQGQQQSVGGLEPGDRIRVDAVRSNGRLTARTIEVLQDVRSGGGYGGYGGGYGGSPGTGGDLDGAISYVDPNARLIVLTRGGYSGTREQVRYDGNTQVEYQGQVFRPEQLEAGDVVRVQARRWGNDWLAERIWVEVDARSR